MLGDKLVSTAILYDGSEEQIQKITDKFVKIVDEIITLNQAIELIRQSVRNEREDRN